ncbi:glycosyltransferase family 2 protein [Salipiger sp. IMCC34102]|uniref:glycosyltransferase family 2 protein n=1 Tax=Salipiger sp. IMCC34102 TaxID=2510647 RepID=UPI00101E05C8|nr:glycosyltransferase family 2 protein [Salipiger sp. IMCC34102]RYH01249.1 glycosyltransferase family 2 protein [Salipiger sp. IMCC34102]
MTPALPRVLTSILNYRTPEMTIRAVAAARTAMEGIAGEILVVDNASGDGSFEVLRDHVATRGWDRDDRVRVLASPVNGGFGAGHNIALRAGLSDGARPDYLYLLNSDAFPAADAIATLLKEMEAERGIGIAGSYIHGTDGAAHCTCFRFPSILGEFESALRFGPVTRLLKSHVVAMEIPDRTIDLDWTAGASMMLRRSMLDRIGGFDETFFLYFEETELCRRARDAGWRVAYVPASKVAHVGSASTGMKRWSRIPGYYLDSRLRYLTKTHGRAYAACATLAHAAGAGLDGIRGLAQRRARTRPPRYTRDLLIHHLRALAGPGRRHPAPSGRPAPNES